MRWLLILLFALATPALAQESRLLDDFAAPAAWRAQASDGVTGTMRPFEGGLRLDYDFSRGSGYAYLRRALPLELPANFELRFRLRGQGPANALEIKLTDASGENVWWHRRADYVPPGEWQVIRIRRRQIEFAWGPTADRTLRRTAAIEFVVAAGSGGGRGWIAVDDLEIVPLPEPPAVPPAIVASADAGEGAALAVDGNRDTFWRAPRYGGALVLDLGYRREFGGLVLRWLGPADEGRVSPPEGQGASQYDVALSDDGLAWREVGAVRRGNGGADWLKLPESEARYIRIRPRSGLYWGDVHGTANPIALTEVEVRPLAFGASDNAFVAAVAAEAPRGAYPRGFVGEQNYWTLVAEPTGGQSGLIDEDGAIEVGRGGFSVEPSVYVDGDGNWANSRATQSLREDGIPIPTVVREGNGWALAVTAIPDGDRIVAHYRLRNTGTARQRMALTLQVRPFQVNSPQQFLNITGGVSPIRTLAWRDDTLSVNGAPRVMAAARYRGATNPLVTVQPFDQRRFPIAWTETVEDPTGLASATISYDHYVLPGGTLEAALSLGLDGSPRPLALADVSAIEAAAVARWSDALGDVRITGPAAARPALDTLRTALAHILATREGPALRPGSRSYARAWIRDGAMMSSALLRMGLDQPAIAFLEYYAPFQYPDGKVPCCVDARGADPVPENDSDGEFIHLVAQAHRYAPDMERLRRLWPRVRAAAEHVEAQLETTRIPANHNTPLYGLLPPSISHEGYSARPAYSYWDDFWALTGLRDAVDLARALGRGEDVARLETRAQLFYAELRGSIAEARRVHAIAFIPGAADLGDFDATSTTIALAPAGLQHLLPADALAATFERYWAEFTARRDGRRAWDAYTPYEWRNVGAFVRLGWRRRAAGLFDYFMADRRPAGWNQWAEVVGRLPREPRFIGDMPHGWVASDYINALLDMIAYERPRDRALVLAAGIPDAWLAGAGISVERLRTPYGRLSYSLRAEGRRLRIAWRLEGRAPPGGLVLGLGAERALTGLSGDALLPR
ncbi:MAG TPA: discoidin domain-containing protein [Allosphingosinicella sp.]|jgi:hypothetical protein|nr:discoidin domain-containing protein [Allosphingosinicella sp.]